MIRTMGRVFIFLLFASCSSSNKWSTKTYSLCSDCISGSLLVVVSELGPATLTDEAGNAVSLTNSTITATQTLNKVEETTCYDTYPGYSFESLLTFSFEEAGGETTTVTLIHRGGSSYYSSYYGSIQINGNDVSDVTHEALSSSSYDVRFNASYTNQGGQSRVLSLDLDTDNDGRTTTIYSPDTTCQLDCTETEFQLGDGSHSLACDYQCSEGTSGSFETESVHADTNIDPLEELFAHEESIRGLAASCTYSSVTTAEDYPETIEFEIN